MQVSNISLLHILEEMFLNAEITSFAYNLDGFVPISRLNYFFFNS